jgi:hypothetical protein
MSKYHPGRKNVKQVSLNLQIVKLFIFFSYRDYFFVVSLSTESVVLRKPALTAKLQSFSSVIQHILSHRQFPKFQSPASEQTSLTPSKNVYQHMKELLS